MISNKRTQIGLLGLVCSFLLTMVPIMASKQNDKSHSKKFVATATGLNTTNSDHVCRITFTIEGYPHTAQRIDEIILRHNGKNFVATDIDGVDFHRYFQWEDDGIISIDVDFPLQKTFSATDSVFFKTVLGTYGASVGGLK